MTRVVQPHPDLAHPGSVRQARRHSKPITQKEVTFQRCATACECPGCALHCGASVGAVRNRLSAFRISCRTPMSRKRAADSRIRINRDTLNGDTESRHHIWLKCYRKGNVSPKFEEWPYPRCGVLTRLISDVALAPIRFRLSVNKSLIQTTSDNVSQTAHGEICW